MSSDRLRQPDDIPWLHGLVSRREIVRGAAIAAGLLAGGSHLSESALAKKKPKVEYRFPKGFLWGAGCSGLQHEGSPLADGASQSIMYRWAHTPGKVPEGGTFDVSADFYRRFRSDIKLMRELNLRAYNFEVHWPRILPEGTGRVNQRGLDFYDRLVDEFLKTGIAPLCNLYVFDHPAALQDRGGWLNRDSAEWFAQYASILFDRLGDRVKYWTTICELHFLNHMSCVAGALPPELRDLSASLRANHHLLLGQGRAVQAFRASRAKGQIGNQHAVIPVKPASASEEDVAAAGRANAYFNLLALDSQLRGMYPQELIDWYGAKWPSDIVAPGDMVTISTQMDFFGMDYYFSWIVQNDLSNAMGPLSADLQARVVGAKGTGGGLREALAWVRERYGDRPILLLEIGSAVEDTVDHGRVNDSARLAYIRDLLTGAHRAISDGVDLRGSFIWSFLDGWEFGRGLSSRYGLVYVDYQTQDRIVKDSGRWYRDMIAANSFNLPDEKS